MPRKLKYHEQKLLKKVDFLNWKADGNLREVKILRREERLPTHDGRLRQDGQDLEGLVGLESGLGVVVLLEELVRTERVRLG